MQQPTQNSRWREMTWSEYYNDVVERARKRGVMVVWISPPRPVHARVGDRPVPMPSPPP